MVSKDVFIPEINSLNYCSRILAINMTRQMSNDLVILNYTVSTDLARHLNNEMQYNTK